MVLDIYIAILLSGIFVIQLHTALQAAERRKTIAQMAMPLIQCIVEAVENATKGEEDE